MKLVTSDYLERYGIPWCYREASGAMAKLKYAFVINLDDMTGPGTHWTTARVVDGVLYYADPFGAFLNGWPPAELSNYPLIVNRLTFQRPETALCGYYAMLFAKKMDTMTGLISQKDFEELLWDAIK